MSYRRRESIFFAINALSSLKYFLRSLCPTIQQLTPIESSILADTSPVNAPDSCSEQFCAPTSNNSFATASSVANSRYGKGGQIITSHEGCFSSSKDSISSTRVCA